MPKVRLNHRRIEALTAGRWMTDFWDDRLTGFGIRVSPSGRKTYVVRYNYSGRKRRVTLGRHPALSLVDAREWAGEILSAVARGKDPQAQRKAENRSLTFEELAEVYLERHAKVKKRHWREDQRVIRVDLLPHWKGRRAKNVQRQDVCEVLDGIVTRGALGRARTPGFATNIEAPGLGCRTEGD